jgi:hypothetical protein
MAVITHRQSRQLELSGWTRVDLDPNRRDEPALAWIRQKTEGRCHNFGWQYLFEQESDAIVFALKWAR